MVEAVQSARAGERVTCNCLPVASCTVAQVHTRALWLSHSLVFQPLRTGPLAAVAGPPQPPPTTQRLLAGRTLRLACRAEQPDKPEGQQQQQEQQPPQAPQAPAPPAASADGKVEMKDQQNALGPVGNFLMATLLIVLCGLSVLSTVGRQFQV